MVGNLNDARLAATRPDEFLLSDEGCTRIVYLINGVVYKVNRPGYGNTNDWEMAHATSIVETMPANVRIPEMTMFDNVLACEYISGWNTGACSDRSVNLPCDTPEICMPENLVDELAGLGWTDNSFGNAILKGNVYYLVDCAY